MNQSWIEGELDDDERTRNGELTITGDGRSSSSSHYSQKILDEDEKSIIVGSKLSDESDIKIEEIKAKKFRWIEIYKNDFITLKKRINIKRTERKE